MIHISINPKVAIIKTIKLVIRITQLGSIIKPKFGFIGTVDPRTNTAIDTSTYTSPNPTLTAPISPLSKLFPSPESTSYTTYNSNPSSSPLPTSTSTSLTTPQLSPLTSSGRSYVGISIYYGGRGMWGSSLRKIGVSFYSAEILRR